jgi:hypothetical protein
MGTNEQGYCYDDTMLEPYDVAREKELENE